MNRRTKNLEGRKDQADTAVRFRELANRWMAEDPAYDRETWPELEEALDRSRPEYRKLFPENQPKAERRPICPRRQTRDQWTPTTTGTSSEPWSKA